jgi:hypothetical protein
MIAWKAGRGAAIVANVVGLAVVPAPARGAELGASSPAYDERWVYCRANLQVEKSADDVIALIERVGTDFRSDRA